MSMSPSTPSTPASASRCHLLPLAVAVAAVLATAGARAQSFSITGASTTARTLGSGQTGSIAAGGALTVAGGTDVVTLGGNNATLANAGILQATGSNRVIRENLGVSGLSVSNAAGALMQSADADVIQVNKAATSITLRNAGRMISLNASGGGAQAVDFNAITSGANLLDNQAGGLIEAREADAVRPGQNGVVRNAGTIRSTSGTGGSSDGIDLQSRSGVRIDNFAGGLVEGARHGITGGGSATTAFLTTVTNAAGGVVQGMNGSGINIDGFNRLQVLTVTNAGTISGNGITGDGDGLDVDGLVDLTNTGLIQSRNAYSAVADGPAFSEGLSVGGGSIVNSGTIRGLVAAGNGNALGIGISLTGNDITSGANAGNRDGIYANAVVSNRAGGLISGQNSSAIPARGLASGYTVTIDNAAGAAIVGGGAGAAAIQTGLDNDTVTNRGRIDGSSSGRALDLGGGDNTLNLVGGAAVVLGDISGGTGGRNTLALDIGSGNRFAYAGALSNFDSVTVQSGTTSLSGASSYTGTTVLQDGVLELAGTGRLAAAGSLDLQGGTLRLTDAGAAGQSFASLALGASSVIDLGGSSLTFAALGNIAAGARLTIVGYSPSGPALYGLRILGDLSGDGNFQALAAATTLNGQAARYRFADGYTTVSAVPEPGSLAMLLAGLGLVAGIGRRRAAARRA